MNSKQSSVELCRRQKFLDKKKDSPFNPKSSEDFQCDLCNFKASCTVSLRELIEKEHKVIPQLDGQEESFE